MIFSYGKHDVDGTEKTGIYSPLLNTIRGKRVSREVRDFLNNSADDALITQAVRGHTFTDTSFTNWVDGLNEQERATMRVSDALENYQTHLRRSTSLGSRFASGIKRMASGLLSFATSTIAMMAISKGIELVIDTWQDYSTAQEDAIDKGTEAVNKYKENVQTYSESAKLIQDSGKRFVELQAGVSSSGTNKSLTTSEYEEYLSLANQISETFPNLVKGYDSLGNPILQSISHISELNDALREQQQLLAQETVDNRKDYKDSFDAKVSEIAVGNKEEPGLLQQQKALNKLLNADGNQYAKSKLKKISQEDFAASRLTDLHYKQNTADLIRAATDGQNGDTRKSFTADLINSVGTGLGKMLGDSTKESWEKFTEKYIGNSKSLDSNSPTGKSELTVAENRAVRYALKEAGVEEPENLEFGTEEYEDAVQKLEDYMQTIQPQLDSAFTEQKPYIESLFMADDSYSKIKDSTQNIVSELINSMSFDDASKLNFFDAVTGDLDTDSIISWKNNLLQNLQKTDVQDKLSDLFNVQDSRGTMNYADYFKEVDSLTTELSKKVPGLSKDLLKSVTGLGNDLSDLKQKRSDLMNDGLGEKFINSLSNDDMEILWTLNADGAIKTAEEAKKRIQEQKETVENDPDKYYNAWYKANTQANEDEQNQGGTKYDTLLQGYDKIKEAYNKGETGTSLFKTFAAWLSPTGSDDVNNFKENYPKFERYFQDTKDGVNNFLNDISTLQNTAGEKMAEFNKDTGRWSFNVTDLDDLGQKLGIGAEAIGAIFGKLRDYGVDNNIITSAEEGGNRVGELINDLSSESKRNEKLKKQTGENEQGYETSAGSHTFGNQTAIDESDKKLAEYNEDLKETISNTKALIKEQNSSKEAQQQAAIAAGKALAEQKQNALNAGQGDAANLIQEQIDQMGQEFEIPNINAEINFDVGTATENLNSLVDNAWNKLARGGNVQTNLDLIGQKVQELGRHDGDISGLVLEFNDLADAAGSLQRMGSTGDIFNYKDKIGEVQQLKNEITTLASSGQDASNQMGQMSQNIQLLSSAGFDVSSMVDSYNKLAEASGSEFRMKVTGELYEVDDETNGDTEVEAKAKVDEVETDGEKAEIDGKVKADEVDTSGVEGKKAEIDGEVKNVDTSSVENKTLTLQAEVKEPVQSQLSGKQFSTHEVTISAKIGDVDTSNAENKEVNVKAKATDIDTSTVEGGDVYVNGKIDHIDSSTVNSEDTSVPGTLRLENVDQSQVQNQQISLNASLNPLATSDDTKTVTVNEVQGEKIESQDESKNVTVNEVQGEKIEIEDQTKTVDFTLGDSPETVPDASGIANYRLGSYPTTVPSATGVANYVLGFHPTSLPPINQTVNVTRVEKTVKANASGTLTSPAHANGTAYNVLNLRPAYAKGNKVALEQDETALVNEMGTESIIRDNSWFLIPGGMHMQALKKGDIVLNASQTKSLMEHGKASGHGKAYANGTVPDVRKLASKPLSSAYASGSDEEFKEDFDWIEIWQSRFEESIEHLNDAMSDIVGNSWQDQNKYLDRMLNMNSDAQKTNRKAYDKYGEKMNASSLSAAYKDAIRKGKVDIETITDKDLKEKITEYQGWYEKQLQLNRKYDELVVNNLQYSLNKLENIVDDYDKIVDRQESYVSLLSAKNDYNEAVGAKPVSQNYKDMMAGYGETANTISREYSLVKAEFDKLLKSGMIKKGSDQYNEWTQKLNEMQHSIINARTEAAKLAETLREIRWDGWNTVNTKLENTQEHLSDVVDMIDDLDSFDDDGIITENGITKLGLYAIQLENAKKQTAQYDTALNNLKRELDAGLITQDKYNEELADYKDKQRDAQKVSKSARDAILSLVKEGINAAIDAYSELIDKRKEALQDNSDYRSHTRQVEDYEKQLADIQKQINSYNASGSREDLAKVKDLESQKADIKKKYTEYLEDYQTDKQLDALQKEYDDFKEKQEDKIKELETSLDSQEKTIKDSLSIVKGDYTKVYDELGKLADIYGQKLTDTLMKPWENAKNAYQQYTNAIKNVTKFSGSGTVDKTRYSLAKNSSGQTTVVDNGTGQTKKNWTKIGKDWYLSDGSGIVIGNKWNKDNNKWYHTDTNGKMQSNQWIKDKGKWYYLNKDGSMATGWQTIGGKKYYLDYSGAMKTGFFQTKKGISYADKTGAVKSGGFFTVDGKRYYANAEGVNKSGWIKDDGKWYYADGKKMGEIVTGWRKVNNEWYYLNKDGSMKSSEWVNDKGKWYYLQAGGAMAKNAYVKDWKSNLYYWVNGSGEWEQKWNTSSPNLKKYKLAYAKGTNNSAPGWKTIDEEGTELIRTAKGDLFYSKGGDTIFTNEMTKKLSDFSKAPSKFIEQATPKFQMPKYSAVNNTGNITVEVGAPQIAFTGTEKDFAKFEIIVDKKLDNWSKNIAQQVKQLGVYTNANRIR